MKHEHSLFEIKTQIHKAIYGDFSPQVVAVSKKHDVDVIKAFFLQGVEDFAESYAQEFAAKAKALADKEITWHFIGPVQSNKTRVIAQYAQWLQSIDRFKIAERFSQHGQEFNKTYQVLVQVNISGEPQKSGVSIAQLPDLLARCEQLPHLNLRGLMCIASKTHAVQEFKRMKQLFDDHRTKYDHFDTLSMGMSNDYLEAIAQGATMVRIGSALFGKRDA